MKIGSLVFAAILSLAPASAFAACTGQFTTGQICANPTGSTNVPTGSTVSKLFDFLYGTNSGTIIYRSGSGWTSLPGNSSGTQILSENSSGVPAWLTVSGTGTVTSVALAAPPIFTVSGSPVTSGGTLTFTSANESANTFWAGPTSGGATTPAFRGIVIGDFPAIAANTVIGNNTSGSSVPTAMSMPSCSGGSNALIWTTNTGFGCNTLTSTGTVTSVASGTGLTGGPITTTGTLSLASIAADNVLANATGGSAAPGAVPLLSCSTAANALTYNTSTHAFGCNVISGSGTVNTGTAGQIAYYPGSTNVVGGNANANMSAGALTLGVASTTIGQVVLEGNTSGSVTLTPQAAAGTPTITFGTASGTPVVTASAPLAITTATGNITVAGAAGQVLAGSGPAFTATPTLGVSGATKGVLAFAGNTSGAVTVQPAAAAGTWTLTLPTSGGSGGQVLTTDGSGVASWANAAGGGTVNSGTAGQLTYYAASTNTVSGNTNANISAGALTLGQAASTIGQIILANTTSGATTLTPGATAAGILTLPAGTDTLVGRATTDTLTNKSIAGSEINSGIVTASVGGTGVNNGSSTLTLGANLTTTGAGASTMALPATGRTFTFPNASVTMLSTGGATMVGAPSNPTGTTATGAGVMMGLGSSCAITPLYSSRVYLEIQGGMANDTSGDGALNSLFYGTGTAPVNQAASTGTGLGGTNMTAAAANQTVSFANIGVATGLSPGTAYWFDLRLAAVTAGTAIVANVSCTAYEM
jgi:hypothetical protein